MPHENISSNVRYGAYSSDAVRRDWMFGVCKSSAKMYAFGAEVARVTKSAAARGDVADLERSTYCSKAFKAFCCV